jgi:Restriction endonuclease
MTGEPFPIELAKAAEQLRRQEFSRLSAAVTPRIEAFRSMTADAFRTEIALMLERLGHTVVSSVSDIVTTKDGRKYVTACATPTEQTPSKAPALRRLHDVVIAAGAARGFYVTPRSFTPEAEHYAASAPIDLVDGRLLIRSMHLSRKGMLLPVTYKAMCCQCGELVQHRIDKDEALPCSNRHLVAPTIARAALVPYRAPLAQPGAGADAPKPARLIKPLNMSLKAQRRRKVRAHNHQMRARALKKQREQQPNG